MARWRGAGLDALDADSLNALQHEPSATMLPLTLASEDGRSARHFGFSYQIFGLEYQTMDPTTHYF
jgi:hypothetical protein